ncbi:MAG: hypothetical protein NTV81_04880, partial [Candidatus Komeilibacteria bacterium]|nr:hypothetical protein [Candidatus Komeilibacteria bacterium]
MDIWVRVLLPIIESLFFLITAWLVGRFILSKIKAWQSFGLLLQFALSVLVGYSGLAYLFLILSFWPPIQSWSIWLICLLILIIGWRAIKKLILDLSFYFKKNERLSLIEKILFLLVIFFFIFYLSSALVPPYRTDALAYHLPEAKQIAEQGIFSLGGYGSFFANMPKLMEILYAGLFTAGSFSLIHLVHYQMFLALLVVIFCFVKKEYDRLGGLLSILGIFTLYELGVNATNAYVDGAMVAFQIVAALFFIWWWKNQEKSILILVGLLFGLAVSVKYLAWYAVVLVGLFWLIKTVLGKKTWPTILTEVAYLGIPFIIASGFWYFKSWFLVGNPFYPFIFSHQGITEEVFKSAYVAVWQFIPQTLTNYLLMPFTLFWDPYYISVLAAFLLVIIG